MNRILILIATLMALTLVVACSSDDDTEPMAATPPPVTPPPANPQACPTDGQTVSYTVTVNPIFQTNCVPCHNAAQANGGVRFDNYTVASTNAARAAVRTRAGTMPPGGTPLPECDIRAIEGWSAQGAQNN